MTKKMIDAEALLDWIEVQSKKNYAKTFNSFFTSADFIKQEITRLKSLASATPEPQESIFDADGWCWDMSHIDMTDNDPIHHLVYRNTRTGFIGQYVGCVSWKCYDQEFIAWRPLPTLPKEDK